MKHRFIILILSAWALAWSSVFANQISFEHISIDDGLSHVSATNIAQDSLGRIWIGTRDGLNVYDGSVVKTFRQIRGDSTSLLGLNIRDIYMEARETWVCTREGVSRLNLETMRFQQFPTKNNEAIIRYNNEILLGSHDGLKQLLPNENSIIRRSDLFKKQVLIRELYVDHANILWIGSSEGLFRHDPRAKNTVKILDGDISCAFIDSRKRIWIGTEGNGFFLLNKNFKVVRHYLNNESSEPIVNNYIRSIAEDSKGNIWVGTFLGLNILDGVSLEIHTIKHREDNPSGLSHNSVYCFLNDAQGTMWVGTYFGGVNFYNPNYNIYTKYLTGLKNTEGTGYRVIGKMVEDQDKNLWIATEGGGLDFLDRKTRSFKHYTSQNQNHIQPFNNVKSMYLHTKDTLIFGSHLNGIFVLDIPSGKIKNYYLGNSELGLLNAHTFYAIIPYHKDYLLASNAGVILFNIHTETFSHFFTSESIRNQIGNRVYNIFEDSFNKLWIGTEKNGLSSYDLTSKELRHYENDINDLNSISNNSIYSIYEDHLFRLWIGTLGGGLNLYDRDKDNFNVITSEKTELLNNFIYGISESRFGNLWILTSKGLSRYDLENNRFFNYQRSNGFPMNLMNEGAMCLTSDGELFIGGISGLVSFKEEDIFKKNKNYNLVFSSLRVNNKDVKAMDQTKILSNDLAYTDEFKLKPSQDVFSIQFSACNYIKSSQTTLQYKLENFNDNWINTKTVGLATYTNLDPGNYTFSIRAISNIDKDVIAQKSIDLKILPPWYRTWYAYLSYVVILSLILLYVNKTYISQLRLKDRIKAEQREKEQLKALNQSKLRFFTNISHEFRTPLTLITGTLESVLEDQKTKPGIYRKLNAIHGSAIRLNNLISELLDFRKLDQGFLKLKVCERKLHPFLNEIYLSFVEYAHSHKIEYNYTPPEAGLKLWFDNGQLEKVFYNLISNAFKLVSEKSGKVDLSIKEEADHVDILITDNGPGMQQEMIDKIFDRFYQIDQLKGKIAGKGSGLGLALSKGIVKEHHGRILVESAEGKGSTFTVRILKGNKHFDDSELSIQTECETNKQLHTFTQDTIEPDDEPVDLESAPTLLIVEDNDDVRQMIKGIFKESFKILEASDGVEGMDVALKEQPELIISDVMMPNLSGTEMCAKLKRNIQTCHIPIILLTARTAMEYKIEGLETGADEYITKPFNVKYLRTRVKNLLHNRYILQDKFKSDPQAEIKEIASNSKDLKLLNDAKSIIEQHLDDTSFDVNTFAREMGLGRTRLYAKIKGITGLTPNEFMLSTRLKKAAEMLMTNPDLNVSEVAYSVGFSTPRYFSRCFREHFGTSPSKYGGQEPEAEAEIKKLNDV